MKKRFYIKKVEIIRDYIEDLIKSMIDEDFDYYLDYTKELGIVVDKLEEIKEEMEYEE